MLLGVGVYLGNLISLYFSSQILNTQTLASSEAIRALALRLYSLSLTFFLSMINHDNFSHIYAL